MNFRSFYRYVFWVFFSVFLLAGCGSNNDGGEFVAPDKVGYFIDSPVANLDYECGDKKDKTNSEGKFTCSELPVTFKVGGIEIGILYSIPSDGKVYPQDLLKVERDDFTNEDVLKMAILLQSLDDDGDISSEIILPNEINSTQNGTLSEMTLNEVIAFLTSIGKTAVSQEDAIKHLQEQFGLDVTKPVITLNGASIISLTKGTAYTELGATATDDRDGNLTITVSGSVDVNTVGSYTVTYKATDSAGNEASVIRTVNITEVALAADVTKPVITLNGASSITLTKGTAYTELGATATDDRDGTVTVTTSGTVDVNTVGSYTITYKAQDSVGNEVVVTRMVNVISSIAKTTIKGVVINDPIIGATVKLLSLDNDELEIATTDSNGSYSLDVDKSKITDGFILEATGGTMNGTDFNETLRAIYKSSEDVEKANITLLTTLVAKMASEDSGINRSGTLLDKRDDALQKLSDMGMIKQDDWFKVEPSFVNMEELRAVVQGDGLDVWLNGLIVDLSDNDLESFKMAQFPKAHGGIVDVYIQSDISIFQGDSLERDILTEIFDSAEENATYQMSLEDVPSWISIVGKKLKIIVPETEPQGVEKFKITIIKEHETLGRSKEVSLSILEKIVLLEGTLDEYGGQIENQWKDISISVEAGKLSQSYTLKYIGGIDATGSLVLDMDISPDISDEESSYLHLIEPPANLLKRNYFQEESSTSRSISRKSTSFESPQPINLNDGCHNEWLDRNGDGFIFDKVWMSNLAYFNDSKHVHKSSIDDSFSGFMVGKLAGIDDDSFGLPRLQDRVVPVKNKIKKIVKCASALRSSIEENDENLNDKTPVLFVHGFIPDGTLGGVDSREYFGKFPKFIEEVDIAGESFVPFIFQWKTNARFQDVATELGSAIDMITKKTGKEVHIIAHSFGGLLTRTLVQGLSTNYGIYNKVWSEKHIASITTVGTPHSGIFLDPKENVEFDNQGSVDFPRGIHSTSGVGTFLCRAISCYQSGTVNSKEENPPSNWSEESKKNYKQAVIASNPNIYGIKDELGFIPYKLYKSLENYPNIPTEQLMGLVSSQSCKTLETDDSKCYLTIKLKALLSAGDGLISINGQRFSLSESNEVGSQINKLSLWELNSIEEHLLGFDTRLDNVLNNDLIPNRFNDQNEYIADILDVEYLEQGILSRDKAVLTAESLGKASRYVLGYNHSDTQYKPRIENPIYAKTGILNNYIKRGSWYQKQYTEMGLNSCSNVNYCPNSTWEYVKRFLSLYTSKNIDAPLLIKATGDVKFIGPIQETSNRSLNREISVVPFPVTIEAYTGSILNLFSTNERTTLKDDGTYELNVTYSPDTNYTVIAYPEDDTVARIGAFVRASASKFLTTFGTLEESTLHFPTITLTDDNYQEGNITIKVTDGTSGTVLNSFDAEILNSTGINVDEGNSLGIDTGYSATLAKGDYTVKISKEGYNAGEAQCTVTANETTECIVNIVSNAQIANGEITAVLSWGATPSDLDSHLVRKTEGSQDYHVYYGNKNGTDANLDRDDTSSYGPETITINNVNQDSVYTYYVYNFSGGAGNVLPNSGAKLELNFNGTQRTFTVPNEEGRYWKVFEIDNGRIIPCSTGCVQGDFSGIVRNLDRDAYLFNNLPNK